MPTVLDPRHHLPLGRAIARQLIGDQHPGCSALALEQLTQQALGGALVASALHQHVEHEAVLVDRPPQPVLLADDGDRDLVEVPLSCLLSSAEDSKEHSQATPGQNRPDERARQEAEPNRRRLSKL